MPASTFAVGLLLSVLVALLPTLVWASFVWWCDRYEREPAAFVAVCFLWGALPAVIISFIVESLFDAPMGMLQQSGFGAMISAAAVAPIVEELAKVAAIGLILLLRRGEIDDVLDGIVYGAMVGFGFGMTENVLYFASALNTGGWGDWWTAVFLRGILFGLNHAFFSALAGAGIGYAQQIDPQRRARFLYPLVGLGAAVAAHAMHNLGTTLSATMPAAILLSLLTDAGGVMLIGVMILLSLRQESQWMRLGLASEVGVLIDEVEYRCLVSKRSRLREVLRAARAGGWRAIRRVTAYQQAAAELAFARRRSSGHPQEIPSQAREEQLRAQFVASRRSSLLLPKA